jgi:hypothetical protein
MLSRRNFLTATGLGIGLATTGVSGLAIANSIKLNDFTVVGSINVYCSDYWTNCKDGEKRSFVEYQNNNYCVTKYSSSNYCWLRESPDHFIPLKKFYDHPPFCRATIQQIAKNTVRQYSDALEIRIIMNSERSNEQFRYDRLFYEQKSEKGYEERLETNMWKFKKWNNKDHKWYVDEIYDFSN